MGHTVHTYFFFLIGFEKNIYKTVNSVSKLHPQYSKVPNKHAAQLFCDILIKFSTLLVFLGLLTTHLLATESRYKKSQIIKCQARLLGT